MQLRYWTGTTQANLLSKMADDDLRFGDVDGSTESTDGTDMVDLFRQAVTALVAIYVLLKIAEILFNVPIPII